MHRGGEDGILGSESGTSARFHSLGMESGDATHVATVLLARLRDGDPAAAHELLPIVHAELMSLAQHRMAGRRGHTLQPTALVHEAWIKLIQSSSDFRDRRHFLACAARAMRQILTDHARAKRAHKRGGDVPVAALDGLAVTYEDRALDLVVLDDLLTRLEAIDARLSPVVELRYFGGLENDEVAEVLGTSTRTVERRWKLARGWLRQQLSDEGDHRS